MKKKIENRKKFSKNVLTRYETILKKEIFLTFLNDLNRLKTI